MIPMPLQRAAAKIRAADDQFVAGCFDDLRQILQRVLREAVADGVNADGFTSSWQKGRR
ncbi:MAG: hypothetical protein AAF585_28550 [Verrucomicrobiota bacterium]